ncbi:fatty acyl-AMP ligase [Streptomyces sp. NPDC056638]|uniref:fatty acyl-AMP ligase n=1 Tax=Streptomyces sp. NPDC056638 TaxID=3345887 RepID=UPI00367F7E91
MLRTDSIVDVVREYAERRPDDTAYSFLAGGPAGFGVARQLSYGDIDSAAQGIASALLNSCGRGDRVLVVCPPGPEFLTSFLGALYAGLVPVPAPLPSGGKGQQDRVKGIIASSGATAVLTDEQNVDAVSAWAADVAPAAVCLAAERTATGTGEDFAPEPIDPNGLAFLQYTSGSTGDPRGVMVSHASLLVNLQLIQRSYGVPDGARVGGWLPPYHDMGLMGTLLLPLLLGGQAFIMAPKTFLLRPWLWLEMIDRYGVDFSPAPNFAYDLCVRRVSAERVAALDLSRWRWAVNGAEPVQHSTVQNFISHFAPAGLRAEALSPSYGMAEATLFVSGSPGGVPAVVTRVDGAQLEQSRFIPVEQGEGARLLVSSGPLSDDFDLRIVDPLTRQQLPPDQIGEIWLRGQSVGQGYWRQEEATERGFRAYIADGAGPFLRTGDLGVCHDGQLYVTGRIKEVIILNGRNIYPQDIERAARDHAACADGTGAAFTVAPEGVAESIVLVQEVRWRDQDLGPLRDVARGVIAGLTAELGVPVGSVVFVKPGAVLRSTSGKVRRIEMRRLFESGALGTVLEELDDRVRRAFRATADTTA